MRKAIISPLVALMLVVLTVPTVAASPKTGCPAGQGWGEWTISDATARIWPALLDPGAFPGGPADLEAAVGSYDRNGDGSVCLKIMWGEDLNPSSHWYQVGVDLLGSPVEQFLPRDNNSGA